MNCIPFPSSYKKSLLSKTKNITIRIKNELGKYKVGKIYKATSCSGKEWGIRLKVNRVNKTTVDKLSSYAIPQKTINPLLKKGDVSPKSMVEVVSFEVID
ncbi:MAG TPA: hypothetical protein VMW04_02485 [Patescibacteria group bacterium]|nr:hypothetical protein [Patescibacteria group bacterium]